MRRSYALTPQALLDLLENAAYIFLDSDEAAERFQQAAESEFERLALMPEIGVRREHSHSRLEGLRMWPIPDFPNHLIFYLVTKQGIEVVRLLHAARDVSRLLRGRENP